MALIYSMLMAVHGYLEDQQGRICFLTDVFNLLLLDVAAIQCGFVDLPSALHLT